MIDQKTTTSVGKIVLKPCPFCGEVPHATKHFRDEVWSFVHRCSSLYCAIVIDWTTLDRIEAQWNARVKSGKEGGA